MPSHDAAWRSKVSTALRGRPHSASHNAAVARALTGRSQPWEHGRPHTDDTKRRLSVLGQGNDNGAGKRSPATRRRMSVRRAEQILAAGSYPSRLEREAAELLLPLGYERFAVTIDSHTYDFAHVEERIVVEVNGCYWHSHHLADLTCPVRVSRRDFRTADMTRIAAAAGAGYRVIELWACRKHLWFRELAVGKREEER